MVRYTNKHTKFIEDLFISVLFYGKTCNDKILRFTIIFLLAGPKFTGKAHLTYKLTYPLNLFIFLQIFIIYLHNLPKSTSLFTGGYFFRRKTVTSILQRFFSQHLRTLYLKGQREGKKQLKTMRRLRNKIAKNNTGPM